jgi:hypothetical protein
MSPIRLKDINIPERFHFPRRETAWVLVLNQVDWDAWVPMANTRDQYPR